MIFKRMVCGVLNTKVSAMSISKSLLPIILIAASNVGTEKVEECTCPQVKACRQQAREQLFEKCLTQCKVSLVQGSQYTDLYKK